MDSPASHTKGPSPGPINPSHRAKPTQRLLRGPHGATNPRHTNGIRQGTAQLRPPEHRLNQPNSPIHHPTRKAKATPTTPQPATTNNRRPTPQPHETEPIFGTHIPASQNAHQHHQTGHPNSSLITRAPNMRHPPPRAAKPARSAADSRLPTQQNPCGTRANIHRVPPAQDNRSADTARAGSKQPSSDTNESHLQRREPFPNKQRDPTKRKARPALKARVPRHTNSTGDSTAPPRPSRPAPLDV